MSTKITDWNQIIGHKHVVAFLQKSIQRSILPNVCLFYGNPGLGKSSLAKLVAVDLVSRYKEDVRQRQINSVILKDESTASIKIFNMSNISDKEEEIQKVKAELTLGFSETGRKVLILDEAHGMSKKAQDALLPSLEYLEDGVYVFLCTTDISVLRDALLSRCRKIPLRDITTFEISKLIKEQIKKRQLKFTIPEETVVTMIAYYCNNSPREACNLIECYEQGQIVSAEDLSVFIETGQAGIIIQLVHYLYSSLTLGLDYIDTLQIDSTFASMLVEVCKAALGGDSKALSVKDRQRLMSIIQNEDVTNLIMFAANALSSKYLNKRAIIAAFMKSHKTMVAKPTVKTEEQIQYTDLGTIQQIERSQPEKQMQKMSKLEEEVAAPSLLDLLNNSEFVR